MFLVANPPLGKKKASFCSRSSLALFGKRNNCSHEGHRFHRHRRSAACASAGIRCLIVVVCRFPAAIGCAELVPTAAGEMALLLAPLAICILLSYSKHEGMRACSGEALNPVLCVVVQEGGERIFDLLMFKSEL